MGLKKYLVGAVCAGVIFVSFSSFKNDYISIVNCESELDLFEYSFNNFDDL